MENYQQIIQAFINGKVDGLIEVGQKPDHIETQISHIFLFPETVYKICKRDNLHFNQYFRDLAHKESRFNFYKADFFENNYFSPEVYLSLYGIKIVGDDVKIVDDINDVDDVIIKMKRIDPKYNLSNLLHEKTLSEKDFQAMGYQQTKEVALYPHQPQVSESYYDIFQRRLNDLRDWMYSAVGYFSKESVDEIILIFRNYVEKNKSDFIDFDTKQYVVSLDNHSDNIFYKDGKIFFLDIYPPKEDWMIVVPCLNIYRPATDILLLLGEKFAQAFIKGYKDYYGDLDEKHNLFYFVYSAAIQGVSLYNLSGSNKQKGQDAKLYKDYIITNISQLKK